MQDSNNSPETTTNNIGASSKILWLTIILFAILRIVMLVEVPLADTTEARYAEIARKMVVTNNWVTPQHDYGVPFWAKPPLSTWLSAAGIKLFGATAFASRIFIFLTAVIICLFTYHWVKRITSAHQSLLSIAVLATTTSFFISAGMVMTDLVMICGTSLCMVAFWDYIHAEDKKQLRYHAALFFLGISIGLVAKGPIAVVLTLIPIGLWSLLQKKTKLIFTKTPWILGTLIILVVAVPWYILAERATPGFINYFIVGEHISRFLISGWEGDLYGNAHSEPLGTIWIYWFLTTLPWSPILIFFAIKLFLQRKAIQIRMNAQYSWTLYLLVWSLAPLLFFTPARNIIPSYSLSGSVACALLTVQCWKIVRQQQTKSKSNNNGSNGILLHSAAAFAFILFFGLFVIFSYLPLQANKFTASFYTDAIAQDSGSRDTPFYYYGNSRSYSAEFYTKTKLIKLPDQSHILPLLENNTRDYICISTRDHDKLAQTIRNKFNIIFRTKKHLLIKEK